MNRAKVGADEDRNYYGREKAPRKWTGNLIRFELHNGNSIRTLYDLVTGGIFSPRSIGIMT